ncbi:MAG TPA: peptidylprolyl isomerase [Bryobacteraceae bacterium]|nr:peptidylprolyl isomerase [Bryobacteraceae bacterium]
MKTRSILLLFLPALCLVAQQTMELKGPDGKPIIGPDGKPATVTLSADRPAAQGPALAALPPDKVILAVEGEKITAAELDRVINVLPEQTKAKARGEGRREFAEDLVRMKLLAQEARRRKLDQSPEFQAQIAFQTENLLAAKIFQEMAKNAPVDEAAALAWYEKHKAESESVKASHILIRMKGSPLPVKPEQKDMSEEEARSKAEEIRKKLAAGADFAAIAKAESDDPVSGANGGDLGTFGHGQMVPSFEEAAFAMKAGEISQPVRSQFGYHIIKVEEKKAKTFAELRPEIEQRLRPEMARQKLEEMRKTAAVTFEPSYYGEEKPALAAPAPPAPAAKPAPEAKPQPAPQPKPATATKPPAAPQAKPRTKKQ